MTTVLAGALIAAGALFLAVSAIGLIRFPDVYTRAHVVAKSETLGIILVLGGLLVLHGPQPGFRRLLLVVVFAMIANPTAVHALTRAAQRAGVEPWTRSSP